MPVRPAVRLIWSVLLAATVGVAAEKTGARIEEPRVEALFRPATGAMTALSADGKYLAYTQQGSGELLVVVTDLERQTVTARISADEDRPILHSKEKRRARLRFLEWADGHRLVFAPEIEIVPPPVQPPNPIIHEITLFDGGSITTATLPLGPTVIAPIMAIDADGKNAREIANTRAFRTMRIDPEPSQMSPRMRQKPSVIRGFAAGDRSHLLVEIAGHEDRSGLGDSAPTQLFRIDVRSGKITEAHSETGAIELGLDAMGKPRLAIGEGRGLGATFSWLSPETGRWTKLPALPGAAPDAAFALSPEAYFGERSVPLGFDRDPGVLIYASNLGRDTFGVYGLELRTGRRTSLALRHPGRDLVSLDAWPGDGHLVFDRHRHHLVGVRVPGSRPLAVWIDAEVADVQAGLERQFPGRSVTLLEWDAERQLFVARVTGGAEPGRIFRYRRESGLATEVLRGNRTLATPELHDTRPFESAGPDGVLSGFLTVPRTPRLTPTPLIVWFAPGLPGRPHPEYDPQAQLLADLGFFVCRLNQRGVSGLGRRHLDSLRADPDGAPAADAVAAIEWIAARHRIDRKRVVAWGEGVAGYFALRATQVQPEAFRCAVVFDPVTSLHAWVRPLPDSVPEGIFAPSVNALAVTAGGGSRTLWNYTQEISGAPTFTDEARRVFLEGAAGQRRAKSVNDDAARLSAAAFLAMRGDRFGPRQTLIAAGVEQLKREMKQRDLPCVAVTYDSDYAEGLPAARTRLYRALEEFFHLHLYNFDVKIGPARVVK
jgi:hypothetical protein